MNKDFQGNRRVGDCDSMVGHLPSMWEALSLIASPAKPKSNQKGNGKEKNNECQDSFKIICVFNSTGLNPHTMRKVTSVLFDKGYD